MTQQTITITLEAVTCCSCGLIFGLEAGYQKRLRENHEWFHCPNGHPQHYSGPSKAEKLREQLAEQKELGLQEQRRLAMMVERERASKLAVQDQLDATRRSKAAIKGQLTKTKRRIGKGVCPCCNRHFANVEGHMLSQHPDYATETPT